MTPENGYPVAAYTAEYANPLGEKDDYLLQLIEDIEHLRKMDDVMNYHYLKIIDQMQICYYLKILYSFNK